MFQVPPGVSQEDNWEAGACLHNSGAAPATVDEDGDLIAEETVNAYALGKNVLWGE